MSTHIRLIVTVAFGLESITANELKSLGYKNLTIENGEITLTDVSFADVCRLNLHLRTAERVYMEIGHFEATNFDHLFDNTKSLLWNELFPREAKIIVKGKSVKSQLHGVPTCQAMVKKAIIENLQQKYSLEQFPESGPLFTVFFSILKDHVSLRLDTSGMGLHKRGYRTLTSPAPLRETVAAGILLYSYWDRNRPFCDPFCGSGTFPIEAALIAANIAPGMLRTFDAEYWPFIPKNLWKQAREEAKAGENVSPQWHIQGTDSDERVIRQARFHAQKAGVDKFVHLQKRDFKDFSSNRSFGCLITNPPYGERIGEVKDITPLYHLMGKKMEELDRWSCYILSAFNDTEKCIGKKADRRRKLYNGKIQCQLYQYIGPAPPGQHKAIGEM